MNAQFNGFSPETVDFLFSLSFDNTLAEKEKNRQRYQSLISHPLTALYQELKPVAESICPFLDTRKSRCLSSPYTDRRFTDKPIKDYLYLRFRENRAHDSAGLYFDMGCDSYSFGLRFYKQTAKGLRERKQVLAENPEKFASILEQIQNEGYCFKGEAYQRDHFPDFPEGALKQFLNRKNLYFTKEFPLNERCFSHELAEELKNGFVVFQDFLSAVSPLLF